LEIGIFPDCNMHRRLAYSIQQIIAHELEVERLKRASILTGLGEVNLENVTNSGRPEITKNIQNKSFDLSNNIKQCEKNVTSLKEIVSSTHFSFYCQFLIFLTISDIQRLFWKYHYK